MPVKVNGEDLDPALIHAESSVIRPYLSTEMAYADPREVEARVQEWARENAIDRLLLRQAALADAGLTASSQGESEIQIRIERLVERNAGRIAAPRQKEVTEYYRKRRQQLVIPERVHAAHIVKNVGESKDEAAARLEIEAIENELNGGALFEEVADRSSDCPGRGGDLGWFPRGEMVEEFDRVVFALTPGARSGIFRTPFGFHLAKLYERAPEHPAALDEVRGQIEETLLSEKRKRALDRLLDHLRAKAVIERS